MRDLFERRYVFRQNWGAILGLALCVYFSYHLILGERSYIRLIGVQHALARTAADHETLLKTQEKLTRQVEMLRPGSMNRDYVEERARVMLGYRSADDIDVMGE